jgi:hypothetical protein
MRQACHEDAEDMKNNPRQRYVRKRFVDILHELRARESGSGSAKPLTEMPTSKKDERKDHRRLKADRLLQTCQHSARACCENRMSGADDSPNEAQRDNRRDRVSGPYVQPRETALAPKVLFEVIISKRGNVHHIDA